MLPAKAQWLWGEGLRPYSPAAFLFAIACVGLATFIRWLIGLASTDISPFLTYYPAILVATLVGGWSNGVLATVAAATIALWAFESPVSAIHLTIGRAIGCAMFGVSSGLIVWVTEGFRRVTRRLVTEEAKTSLLAGELQHRIRNILTVVQAIVIQTFRGSPDDAEKKITGRIKALAKTNDLLSLSNRREAEFKSILMAELRPYGEGRIDVQGESTQVRADYATALALVFHELATNAAKYGALSTPTGRLFVSWKTTSERIQITWLEDSGIAVVAPEKGGFGMKLITRLIENMKGTMQNEFRSDGIVWRISFPLPDSEPQQLVPAQTPVSESPLPSPSSKMLGLRHIG